MAGATVICAPLFMPLEFPLDAWYPFSVKSLLLKFILYIMQIFTIAHTTFCVNVDVMIAVFFLYSSARLEMLAFKIERATDKDHVISCIKQHQEIIEYVR